MRTALGSVRQTLSRVLGGHGCMIRPSQPLWGLSACRTQCFSPLASVLNDNSISRTTPCSTMLSVRALSSGSVHSPGDMRSPVPDVDIPVVSFAELIFSRCDMFKDNIAVSEHLTGRKYTYRELKENAIRVASALYRQGFRKGDVITPFTVNLPEFPILVLAAASLGMVISPANNSYTARELGHILTDNGAVAIFTTPQLLPTVHEAIGDPLLSQKVKTMFTFGHAEPGVQFFNDLMKDDGKAFPDNVDLDPLNDVMAMPYSSGTTGMPKGVMLSHHNLVANILQTRELLVIGPGDVTLGVLPFFHIYGLLPLLFGSIYDGARLVTMPRFEPIIFLKALQDEKVSVLHAVPPMVHFLARHPGLSQWRLFLTRAYSGAAPLAVPLIRQFQDRLGVNLYQGFGMTEATVVNVDTSPGHVGTVGHLLPNTQAKLVNTETGQAVGVVEMGEYCTKGPQVMLGYLNNQKATDSMIDAEGWLHTGDLGHMREDGMVVIEDRLKELIKYKGLQVAPAELESVLLTHPAVRDAGVVGVPDERDGELPRAYVVLIPGSTASAKDISDFVEAHVSPHKRLRGGVAFVEEIPKSASGKILRRELKTMALKSD